MKLFKSSYQLAAFSIGCFFFTSCNQSNNHSQIGNPKNLGVEVAKSVVIKYSIAGNKKAVLTGPLMNHVLNDTASYFEFPQTIHVDFYNLQDSVESRLDAHYAKYRDNQNKVFLKDSVKIINTQGDTLHCDELYWDRSRVGNEFYTTKPVKIRTKTHIINGIGMEARQDFKEWHIIQSTGFIKVPSSQFPN